MICNQCKGVTDGKFSLVLVRGRRISSAATHDKNCFIENM